MSKYIIVGDNNFWYAILDGTPKTLPLDILDIQQDIKAGLYPDNNALELFAYEVVGEAKTFKMKGKTNE